MKTLKKIGNSFLAAMLVMLTGTLIFTALFFPAILTAILFKTNILPYTKPIAITSAIISTIWLMTGIVFITAEEKNNYYERPKEN